MCVCVFVAAMFNASTRIFSHPHCARGWVGVPATGAATVYACEPTRLCSQIRLTTYNRLRAVRARSSPIEKQIMPRPVPDPPLLPRTNPSLPPPPDHRLITSKSRADSLSGPMVSFTNEATTSSRLASSPASLPLTRLTKFLATIWAPRPSREPSSLSLIAG